MTPEIGSVNAATSISTTCLRMWFYSITTNNDDVKDCKIRKSLLASQYYLFWLSFYTETAKTSFVKMLDQHKHWLRIIGWESCSHWHDGYSSCLQTWCYKRNDDKTVLQIINLLCLSSNKSQAFRVHAMTDASVNTYIHDWKAENQIKRSKGNMDSSAFHFLHQ